MKGVFSDGVSMAHQLEAQFQERLRMMQTTGVREWITLMGRTCMEEAACRR